MKNVAIMVGKKQHLISLIMSLPTYVKSSTVKRTHNCKRKIYKAYITRHILKMQGVYYNILNDAK